MKLVFANNPLGTPEAAPENAGWQTVTQDGDNAPSEGVDKSKKAETEPIKVKPLRRKKRRPTPMAGEETGTNRRNATRFTNYGGDPATYTRMDPNTGSVVKDASTREFYYAPGESGLTGSMAYPLATPDQMEAFRGDLGWKGDIFWVSPDLFLSAAGSRDFAGGNTGMLPENKEKLKAKMAAGEPLDPLVIIVDWEKGEVTGHEGRHRAVAAKELGITSVPVLVILRGNWRVNPKGDSYYKPWTDAMRYRMQRMDFHPQVFGTRLVFADLDEEMDGLKNDYKLQNDDAKIKQIADATLSQFLGKLGLWKAVQVVYAPCRGAMGKLRSGTETSTPIIILDPKAIRATVKKYNPDGGLVTAVETTITHELGHALYRLLEHEGKEPEGDEEELAESVAYEWWDNRTIARWVQPLLKKKVRGDLYQDDSANQLGTGFPAPQGGSDVILDTNLAPRQYPRPVRFGDKNRRLDYRKKGYPPTGIPEPPPAPTVQNNNMVYPLAGLKPGRLIVRAAEGDQGGWYFGKPVYLANQSEPPKNYAFVVPAHPKDINGKSEPKPAGDKYMDFEVVFFLEPEKKNLVPKEGWVAFRGDGYPSYGVHRPDDLGTAFIQGVFSAIPKETYYAAEDLVVPETAGERKAARDKKANPEKTEPRKSRSYNVLENPALDELSPKMTDEEKLFTRINNWDSKGTFAADPSRLDSVAKAMLQKKKKGDEHYFSWTYTGEDDVAEAQKERDAAGEPPITLRPTLIIMRKPAWETARANIMKTEGDEDEDAA